VWRTYTHSKAHCKEHQGPSQARCCQGRVEADSTSTVPLCSLSPSATALLPQYHVSMHALPVCHSGTVRVAVSQGSRDTHLGRSAATTACVNAHGSSKSRRLIVACSTRDGEGKGRHPKFRAGPRGRGGPLAPTLAAGLPEQHCDAPALLAARHHVQPTRAAAVIIPVGVRDVYALSLRPSRDDALP
jgi:hypothetical protein